MKDVFILAIESSCDETSVAIVKNGKEVVEPATARPYLDRSKHHVYMIKKGDLCYRLFKEKGFRWGGDWKHSKDYQHFEK